MEMQTPMDKMLKIIERIVDSVYGENGSKIYAKEITKKIADFVQSDGSIQNDILDVIRDILKLTGPIRDAPIQGEPIQDEQSRNTVKETAEYHEIQRKTLKRKDGDTEIFSQMTRLATKIIIKVPTEDDPHKGDILSNIRIDFAIRYIDLKKEVHKDSTKNITLQEFESTFRTFFYDPKVYSTFFDELMTGTMRLEAPNR
jgi:tRNA G37 N-methylase Trm5